MTERIQRLLSHVLDGRHHTLRRDVEWAIPFHTLAPSARAAKGLCAVMAAERPAFLPGERIAFLRTVRNLPQLYTAEEMAERRTSAFYAEKGCVFNITPDYAPTLASGLDARRAEILARLPSADDRARAFLSDRRASFNSCYGPALATHLENLKRLEGRQTEQLELDLPEGALNRREREKKEGRKGG